jgi:hypothetical protein
MSNYRNFVTDFPNRCNDLLTRYEKHARGSDREVTLMLSIASAGFTIPFERLLQREPSTATCPTCNLRFEIPAPCHPAGDRERHRTAADMLDLLLDEKFRESELWDPAHEDDWSNAKKIPDVQQALDFWADVAVPIGPDRKVSSVLKHIRNALAHGSIFTRAIKRNQIGLIVLVQKNDETDFSMLAVSPDAFREFLRRWFDFLAKTDTTYGIVPAVQFA